MRDHFSRNLDLHFYTFIPLRKDHLSYKTTFCGPMGDLKSQVSLYCIKHECIEVGHKSSGHCRQFSPLDRWCLWQVL